MVYLLDANVLMDANRDYYAIDRVPEFWEWLLHFGQLGIIKIPLEIFEELSQGNDILANWSKRKETKSALLLDEEIDIHLFQRVLREGYASDLRDDEIEQLGRDPFLIAYALKRVSDRCIVTSENSKPTSTRAHRHIPDVCNTFNIQWCDKYEYTRELDFRTNWRQLNSFK